MRQTKYLFAAMLTCAAMAAPAQADVVRTVTNIAIPNDIDGVYINVVTGAFSGPEFAGYDIDPYSNGSGLTFYTGSDGSGSVVDAVNGTNSVALNLAPGATIGPSSAYERYQVQGTNFRATGTNYYGFRFLNEATGLINYGFAQIETTATSGFPASVTGYSYDNTGAAITVAAITAAAPEPATWGLMILGFGIVGAALRRRVRVRTVSYA